MTTTTAAKPRARRIASDEALSWARNLRLKNAHAKLLLCMLALYVNGDGVAFVSISQLADDCEFSAETVRRRLAWLEEIGAIFRVAQFIDTSGRRNGEGRGKRTSDDIKLLVDADQTAIEARAAGDDMPDEAAADGDAPVSPVSQTGLNPHPGEGSTGLAPPLALAQPCHSGQGLISEPEPEDSPPNPPPGGVEPEHFEGFFTSCDGWRTMRRDRALQAFGAITPEQQALARAASPLHADECRKHRRKSLDAHKLIADRFWENYPDAKLPEKPKPPPERHWYAEGGDALRALSIANDIAFHTPLDVRGSGVDAIAGKGVWLTRAASLDLLALLDGATRQEWFVVAVGSGQFAAWRDRLQEWLGRRVEPRKVWLEDEADVHRLPYSHPDHRFRKHAEGLRVPWQWPPTRDGKIYENEHAEAAP